MVADGIAVAVAVAVAVVVENTGDIMCAVTLLPELSLDQAIRAQHPFPILERYLEAPLVVDGKEMIPAKTQVR